MIKINLVKSILHFISHRTPTHLQSIAICRYLSLSRFFYLFHFVSSDLYLRSLSFMLLSVLKSHLRAAARTHTRNIVLEKNFITISLAKRYVTHKNALSSACEEHSGAGSSKAFHKNIYPVVNETALCHHHSFLP